MQGLINMPRTLQCSILPRSGQHEAVLRQEFRNTAGSFASFEQDLTEDDKCTLRKCGRRRDFMMSRFFLCIFKSNVSVSVFSELFLNVRP